MLTGPQRKFCEGIVKGLTATASYAAAYPDAAQESVKANAYRLMEKDGIEAEIQRLRDKADEKAGSAVMTRMDRRTALASIARAKDGLTENGCRATASDIVAAIRADHEISGDAKETAPAGVSITVVIGGDDSA